jgi:LysM repeat protein
MGPRQWLVRSCLVASIAGSAVFLGACTRPGGATATETPAATVTVRAPASPPRTTATRVASPTVAAPNPAPSAAPTQAAAPSTAPTAAPSAPAAGGRKYVVQAGDTLSGIAEQFGVTVQQLIDANKLTNPDLLLPGQELTIPAQ